MKKKERLALLFLSLLLLSLLPWAKVEAAPKYLIIHLDAVSSKDFFYYLEEGRLPNTQVLFSEGVMIPYGLTLFPGGTEMIYPRLKDGRSNEEGLPVGWGHYHREEERVVGDRRILFDLLRDFPRRGRSNFIYGAPFLDVFMAPVFMNIPYLLEKYRVLEVFWFSTDTYGHWRGREAYERSLYRFDRYLGLLLNRLDLSTVNIILYSDHGMTMGDLVLVDIERELEEAVGDSILYYSYPNIYLHHREEAKEIAKKIIQETPIDFTFYQKGPETVEGFFQGGSLLFERDEEGIRYTYEGYDPFSYHKEGYREDSLSHHEWLLLTKESLYPAAPPNLYSFVGNDKGGDVVILLNPPQIPLTVRANKGNHAGIATTDLMIPILLQGRELEHLYDREVLWLHELYGELDIPFDEDPGREYHTLHYSLEGDLEMRLSPAYRWYLGLALGDDRYGFTVEYDLYSSYLSRLWFGFGGQWEIDSLHPSLKVRYQLDIGSLGFESIVELVEDRRMEIHHQISYRILPAMTLTLSQRGLGCTLEW